MAFTEGELENPAHLLARMKQAAEAIVAECENDEIDLAVVVEKYLDMSELMEIGHRDLLDDPDFTNAVCIGATAHRDAGSYLTHIIERDGKALATRELPGI